MISPDEREPNERLEELTGKVLDGSATPEDRRELEALLANSPSARKIYLTQTLLHAQLSWTAKTWQAQEALPLPQELPPLSDRAVTASSRWRSSASRTRSLLSLTTFGIVMTVGFLLLPFWFPPAPPPLAQQENPPAAPEIVYYDDSEIPSTPVGFLQEKGEPGSSSPKRSLASSTTLQLSGGTAHFASLQGADVELRGPALFGLVSSDSGELFGGAVKTRSAHPGSSYSVQASNLKIVDLGTEYLVTAVDSERIAVEVLEGAVEIQSRRRLPLYFWDFESAAPGLPDAIVGQTGTLGQATHLVDGIIGKRALSFENSPQSFFKIEGGTGETVGTGRFACTSGITIEAMIISRWSGKEMDYDEIFRKEDGVCRVILSFQSDSGRNDFSVPAVPDGPCLSFGLHLEGEGYSELEVPLDGQEGRPALDELRDGTPHHIVATYDSFTGWKAIYIDGRLQAQHQFPEGRMIRSGGPASAFLGNHGSVEPFQGVIDEFAYYDFPLTEEEIRMHFQRVSRGENYFGLSAEQLQAPHWQIVTRLNQGEKFLFNRHTALPVAGRHSPRFGLPVATLFNPVSPRNHSGP